MAGSTLQKRADQMARRLVPAVPVLSHRPWLMRGLDVFDRLCSAPFREFRGLPPNRMRIRVGVGNRLLFNQPYYLEYGLRTVMSLVDDGLLTLDSRMVDIGSGCGRLAHALRRCEFRGVYHGIDVDQEMLAWCNAHLASEHFHFHHADVFSATYNPDGQEGPYRFPMDDASVDLVTAQSLFTHLLEADFVNYLAEAARILEPGGRTYMGVFCLEDMEALNILDGRWSLEKRIGEARVASLDFPEAATAYQREFILKACARAGFSEIDLVARDPHSILVCRR